MEFESYDPHSFTTILCRFDPSFNIVNSDTSLRQSFESIEEAIERINTTLARYSPQCEDEYTWLSSRIAQFVSEISLIWNQLNENGYMHFYMSGRQRVLCYGDCRPKKNVSSIH